MCEAAAATAVSKSIRAQAQTQGQAWTQPGLLPAVRCLPQVWPCSKQCTHISAHERLEPKKNPLSSSRLAYLYSVEVETTSSERGGRSGG